MSNQSNPGESMRKYFSEEVTQDDRDSLRKFLERYGTTQVIEELKTFIFDVADKFRLSAQETEKLIDVCVTELRR